MITQEQQEKIWRWCGFTVIAEPVPEKPGCEYWTWVSPDEALALALLKLIEGEENL